MEFHYHITQYDLVKKLRKARGLSRLDVSVNDLYDGVVNDAYQRFLASGSRDAEIAREVNYCQTERHWINHQRPYYKIYPGIVPYLMRLDLSKVPAGAVRLPLPELCFRFPREGNPVTLGFRDGPNQGRFLPLHSILVSVRRMDEDAVKSSPVVIGRIFQPVGYALLTIATFNPNPSDQFAEQRIISSLHLPNEGVVEDAVQKLREPLAGGDMEFESYENMLRIIVTSLLLSTDVDDKLVVPDVLKADEQKWEKTHDPAILARAKRNLHYGWHVGAALEVSPHWRSPSPLALYWTGPGRATPRYRYRRGCIVHRQKIERVPSGFEGDDDEPV